MKYKCVVAFDVERVGQTFTVEKDSIWKIKPYEYGALIITDGHTTFSISNTALDKFFEEIKE